MPSRATMITGQHPSTHGVWMNGVALPGDAPSVAAVLRSAGYRTAIIGKPHFEPFLDIFARFAENRFARRRHGRAASGLRALRVRHPRRRRAAPLRPLAGGEPPRGGGPVLPGARRRPRGERPRWWRHRRAAGMGQPGAPRVVPHRLGGGPHDHLAVVIGGRRRLVLLDVLPRPAPPLGPACVRGRPGRLARGSPPRRIHRRRRPSARPSSTPNPATGGPGTTAVWCRTTRRLPTGCLPR